MPTGVVGRPNLALIPGRFRLIQITLWGIGMASLALPENPSSPSPYPYIEVGMVMMPKRRGSRTIFG
jgi:hypothetical protein